MANSRITSLSRIEFTDNNALYKYCKEVQHLGSDFYVELMFGADQIYERIANMPASNPAQKMRNKVRAKAISVCLKKSAEAAKLMSSMSVRAWTVFESKFSDQLSAKKTNTKGFEIK